jgi:hypothetical protein
MSKSLQFRPEFVTLMPATLAEGVLYISEEYGTAIHQCACGCGSRVVTPLSSGGWRLTVDGAAVSLDPSIGNWSFPCRSHYWIRQGRVVWAENWSVESVEANREADRREAITHYRQPEEHKPTSFFRRLIDEIRRWFQ